MKLLRVLETGQFERLGSSKTRKVKVRVISATNADLAAMIREGRFREDLYYRLNVIELRCRRWPSAPTTSCRSPSIFSPARRRSTKARAPRSLAYHVAGQRARAQERDPARALLCRDGMITAEDLGLARAHGSGRPAPAAEPDRAMIEAALANARGVISQAAAELGPSRQALVPAHGQAGDPAAYARSWE